MEALTRPAPVDSLQNARTVREDTAELASYFLSDGSQRSRAFLQRSRNSIHDVFPHEDHEIESIGEMRRSSPAIPEVDEPASPDEGGTHPADDGAAGPSALANLLKRASPPDGEVPVGAKSSVASEAPGATKSDTAAAARTPAPVLRDEQPATEQTPLLATPASESSYEAEASLEGQEQTGKRNWFGRVRQRGQKIESNVVQGIRIATNPKKWDSKALAQNVVYDPLSCLPAVAVGLLLNILDALSYGKPALDVVHAT